MPKNILVMTGSPRRGGNSDLLADAFIRGAAAKGHKADKFEAAFKNIRGCAACGACWSKGEPCVTRDDFAELYPLLTAADVIVLCTPVYWFGMTAQIKLAIDKFYTCVSPKCPNKMKIKESCLITCAGDSGSAVFAGVVGTYKGIAEYLGWSDRGVLLVPSVYDKGDVLKTEFILKAEEMGKNIAN